MTYSEAIKEAQKGKEVWRASWGYWYFISSENGCLMMNDPLNGTPTIVRQWEYVPSENDLTTTDWEVVKNKRTWR